MIGRHLIKSWSSTQNVISLSSGEAEYYSMVKGASTGMGCQAMLKEIGVNLDIRLRSDASAAIGVVKRRGLGKVRHIDVSQLWLQEKVAEGQIQVMKVKSEENKSDALTKHVGSDGLERLMEGVGQVRDADDRQMHPGVHESL